MIGWKKFTKRNAIETRIRAMNKYERSKYNKEYREKNRDKIRSYRRKHYIKNKNEINSYRRGYYARDKENKVHIVRTSLLKIIFLKLKNIFSRKVSC